VVIKEQFYWEDLKMTSITVYDIEANELEKIADVNDISVAEVIEMLMEYAEEMNVQDMEYAAEETL
jgi:hypothetical protein